MDEDLIYQFNRKIKELENELETEIQHLRERVEKLEQQDDGK